MKTGKSGIVHSVYRVKRILQGILYRAVVHPLNTLTFVAITLNSVRRKKISVAYLVSQSELFQAENVLKYLSSVPTLDVRILVFPNFENSSTPAEISLSDNLEALAHLGLKLVPVAGSCAKRLPPPSSLLRRGGIIFIDQPFQNLGVRWHPIRLATFWRIAYIPYGFKVSPFDENNFMLPVFSLIWRIFAESDWHANKFRSGKIGSRKKVFSLGYPKMDKFMEISRLESAQSAKGCIVVWAPHWSVRDISLNYGTFEWAKNAIWALTKLYPQIHWVMKPHQRLSQQLAQTGLMSQEEWAGFLNSWQSAKNRSVVTGPDYAKLFAQSTALITDCGSFLGEYTFTKKPILLLRKSGSEGYNPLGNQIAQVNYSAGNEAEIFEFISEVVLLRSDPHFSARASVGKILFPSQRYPASKQIADNIIDSLPTHQP